MEGDGFRAGAKFFFQTAAGFVVQIAHCRHVAILKVALQDFQTLGLVAGHVMDAFDVAFEKVQHERPALLEQRSAGVDAAARRRHVEFLQNFQAVVSAN